MAATATRDELDALLAADDFFQNPYPVYDRLREAAPLHWSEVNGGWMLFRYDDVVATIKDVPHFTNRGRQTAVFNRIPPEMRPRFKPLEDHFSIGLIASDPPDHTRIRGLVNKAFTPRVVEQLRPRIEALVAGFLDAVRDRGEMDVVRDLAYPLPATVIAELFGAPVEERDHFKAWSTGIVAFAGTGRNRPEVLQISQDAVLEMRAFLRRLIEERRREPTDDLLGLMVRAEIEGQTLTEQEMLSTCVTFLTAGHETTTNLIASGLYTLLRHPEQLDALRRDPALWPSAIEEMLRYEPPLQRNPRRIAEAIELYGETLRPGDFVMQVLASANRDPDHFPEPDRFDITRQPNRHLAFGFGIHFCLGAPLARLEAPIALRAIVERMPKLRLATESVTWQRNPLLRGLTALPVRW